jgi:hypothetical protein
MCNFITIMCTVLRKIEQISIPVHRLHRKRRQTHRDIFRAAFLWSRVAHPLPGMRDHGLSCGNIDGSGLAIAAAIFHSQTSLQNDCEFVELRCLPGLDPPLRTSHVGHAGRRRFRIDAANVFVDQFRFISGSLYARRLCDKCGHHDLGNDSEISLESVTRRRAGKNSSPHEKFTVQGQGCELGGVGGMPGMCVDGVPGESGVAGVPGISMSGVPGVPGV